MGAVFWPFTRRQVVDSITTWAAEANQVANPKAELGIPLGLGRIFF